jgi:hypothetical protein
LRLAETLLRYPHAVAIAVKVTVSMGGGKVPVEQVSDRRISAALSAAGREIGTKLANVVCPTHQKTATNVRVHFDKAGNADLQYDSCCEDLGKRIGAALG